MSDALPPQPDQIRLTLTVHNDAQAREVDAAWREIIAGEKLPRTVALEQDLAGIMERAMLALQAIETAIRNNPGTGQAGRLVRFLAGVYNGQDYPFELTELRGLDTELANACLDYLNYDRLGKREVHKHLTGGDRELHAWIERYGLAPPLRLSERQEKAFAEVIESSGRDRYDLLDEAVDDLVAKCRRKASPPKR